MHQRFLRSKILQSLVARWWIIICLAPAACGDAGVEFHAIGAVVDDTTDATLSAVRVVVVRRECLTRAADNSCTSAQDVEYAADELTNALGDFHAHLGPDEPTDPFFWALVVSTPGYQTYDSGEDFMAVVGHDVGIEIRLLPL